MTRATSIQNSAVRAHPPPTAAAACFRLPAAPENHTHPRTRNPRESRPLQTRYRLILRTNDRSSELRAFAPRRFSSQLIEQFLAMRPQRANNLTLQIAARCRCIDHDGRRRVDSDSRAPAVVTQTTLIARQSRKLALRKTRRRNHSAHRRRLASTRDKALLREQAPPPSRIFSRWTLAVRI